MDSLTVLASAVTRTSTEPSTPRGSRYKRRTNSLQKVNGSDKVDKEVEGVTKEGCREGMVVGKEVDSAFVGIAGGNAATESCSRQEAIMNNKAISTGECLFMTSVVSMVQNSESFCRAPL